MKKLFLFFALFLLSFNLFAWDLADFDGCGWYDENTYDWMLKNNKPFNQSDITFSFPKNKITSYADYGTFGYRGLGAHICIYTAKKISETEIEIFYAWKGPEDIPYSLEEVTKKNELQKGKIIVIDCNTIYFENRPYDTVQYPKEKVVFYRASVNPVKIIAKGYTNDSNVRIRANPGLSTKILGTVKRNTAVSIIDSVEVEEKDGTKMKWYLVEIKDRPVAWICAEYVTIVE